MKTKSIILSAIFAVFTLSAFAQLKVDQFGRIGMGTNWPNSGYKCHIKGNLLLTTYPASPFIEFQFKVGNGWPGADMGSTTDMIAFWTTWTSYNKLYAEQFYKMSDASFKLNQSAIESPMKKLLNLKAYKYDVIDRYISENGDSLEGTLTQYGFISQEVEQALPEVKITEDGKDGKLMDYDQIIPLLVAGIQEQQRQISSLEATIAKLIATGTNPGQGNNGNQGNNGGNNGNGNNPMDVCKLFNSSPNPFNNSANIPYYLCNDINTAEKRFGICKELKEKHLI
ncbi:MAG: hypothetical protein OHK0038_26840 [Flammeovirgaceae bacterium]